MNFLLDTNAVSEPQRTRPDAGYMRWLADQSAEDLYLSVLSLGELRGGVAALDHGGRRTRIEAWLSEALALFSDRILSIDPAVATGWAAVSRTHRHARVTVGAVAELIAATAIVHDLTVVTRNTRDFQASGCKLLSPWSDGG